MFTDSKPKFRSRKLDNHKNLEIFRYDDPIIIEERLSHILQSVDESSRGVAPVTTGVDKEEEDELHLKQALQSAGTTKANIPVPKSLSTHQLIPDYDLLYQDIIVKKNHHSHHSHHNPHKYHTSPLPPTTQPFFILSKKLNPPSALMESLPKAFTYAHSEYKTIPGRPEFNCTSQDVPFLAEAHIAPETYEDIVQTVSFLFELNDSSKFDSQFSAWSKDPSLIPLEVQTLFKLTKEQLSSALHLYLQSTKKTMLCSTLKHEDVPLVKVPGEAPVLKIGADPYVCFRRRELKLQSRKKTRRSELQITDRLRALWMDLSLFTEELSVMLLRDRYKKDSLSLEGELFLQYKKIDDLSAASAAGTTILNRTSALPTFRCATQSLMESHNRIIKDVKGSKGSKAASSINSGSHSAIGVGGEHQKKLFKKSAIQYPKGYKAFYPPMLSQVIEDDFLEAKSLFCNDGLDDDVDGGDFLALSFGVGTKNKTTNDTDSNILGLHSKLLNTKDFTQLQTPLGNYNVHAVQSANQIMKPMSHQAWIAATQAIFSNVQAMATKKRPSSSAKGSPRRKKTNTGGVGNGSGGSDQQQNQQNQQTATRGRESPGSVGVTRTSSIQLGSNNQITVQVKGVASTDSGLLASNSGLLASNSGLLVSNSQTPPPPPLPLPLLHQQNSNSNNPTHHLPSSSNANTNLQLSRNSARFTLHGLSQSSQADENE